MSDTNDENSSPKKPLTRRTFIAAGAAGGAVIAAGWPGCGDDDAGGGPDSGPGVLPPTPKGPIQFAMFLDLDKCNGCKACVVACKLENEVPLGVWRREVKQLEIGTFPNTERRSMPWLCNHCDDAPCITRCPTDPICVSQTFPDGTEVPYFQRATYKRPDGLVLVDEERCIGCGFCVDDCPYGVRFINPEKAAATSDHPDAGDFVANKCTHCVNRIEGGVVPACVQTCPAEALVFGNTADPDSEISQLIASSNAIPLVDAFATSPTSRYAGLASADLDEVFVDGEDVKTERCAAESGVPGCLAG